MYNLASDVRISLNCHWLYFLINKYRISHSFKKYQISKRVKVFNQVNLENEIISPFYLLSLSWVSVLPLNGEMYCTAPIAALRCASALQPGPYLPPFPNQLRSSNATYSITNV